MAAEVGRPHGTLNTGEMTLRDPKPLVTTLRAIAVMEGRIEEGAGIQEGEAHQGVVCPVVAGEAF